MLPPSCVAVRLPSQGTLLGDAMVRHPSARVTAVPTGWEEGPDGAWIESLALIEGLPDDDLAALLLAWNRRYGRPVHVVGDSFAVRLPIPVDGMRPPWMAEVLGLGQGLPVMGSVAEGGWAEQWFRCRDRQEAEKLADRLRAALGGVPGAEVRIGEPRPEDVRAWEVLHFAGGTAPALEA